MSWGDWHWGFGFGHWFFGLLLWAGVIVLLVGLFKGLAGGRSTGPRKSAREILEERYARGEIDRQEFERRRADLGE